MDKLTPEQEAASKWIKEQSAKLHEQANIRCSYNININDHHIKHGIDPKNYKLAFKYADAVADAVIPIMTAEKHRWKTFACRLLEIRGEWAIILTWDLMGFADLQVVPKDEVFQWHFDLKACLEE